MFQTRTALSTQILIRNLRWIVGALLGFSLVVVIQAQGRPDTRPVSYTRSVWRVSSGLPEDTVQALAEASDGSLWIGTTGGLANFDGARIRPYGTGLAQSLGVNSVFCLEAANDGSLWAGAEGGGLLHLEGRALHVFSGAEGLTDGFVRSVFQDDRGRLWVGTDNGLFRLEGHGLQRIDTGKSISPLAVHSITEDRQHRIWVGGSRLIAIQQDGSSRAFGLPGAYSENRVKKILQTADGTIWVGTVGGLEYLRGDRFESLPGIRATVRSLLQTADGTLWIGTIGNGLWTFRDGQLAKMRSPGLLPSETVLSILQDRQGQVWIGTQAGLVRLSRTPVSVVPLPKAGDPDFETISGDDRGNVWVAAQSLYLIRNGRARPISYGGLDGVSIRNIYRARDGALWIGTDGSGAYRVTEKGVRHYSAPEQLTNNFIRGFLENRTGDMWIATDEGVSYIGSRGTRKFTESSGLAYFSTRSLLEDRDGAIWIGTDRGLSVWKNGGFRQNAAIRAMAHEKIWSMLQDRRGVLWFGTRDHGVFRDRDGVIRQYTMEQGLPTDSIYQLLQDRRGMFWLTGANTIASIREGEMERDRVSSDRPLSVTVYSMPFGADDAQLYGGREPAGYLAADDTVWFPTSSGAAHVVESGIPVKGPAPRAVIDSVTADGRGVDLSNALRIPASVTRLSFRLSAIYLRPQTEVHLRYKLANFDKAWSIAGPDDVATYTNLKPGRYRFRVQAFDSSKPSAITEADVALTKAPRFYETVWFWILCALLLAVASWAIYRMRLRQIRTRFAAVLAERNRMARELHDTVIQGCTGISALLEAIASTAPQENAASAELLDYAREQARVTIDEARQAVWDMRNEREQSIDLLEAMHGLASQTMREHKQIVATVHGDETLRLNSSTAHEVLMAVREAVYNAVQHSGTERIDMNANTNGEEISVSITDYGCGLPPDRLQADQDGHYGIVGMRERMKRVGGNFELTTVPGKGTTVKLAIAPMSKFTLTERA